MREHSSSKKPKLKYLNNFTVDIVDCLIQTYDYRTLSHYFIIYF